MVALAVAGGGDGVCVQGRKTMNIVAACVYIVCRQKHFPIMLIDISDKLAVNVYVLGKVSGRTGGTGSLLPFTIYCTAAALALAAAAAAARACV